MLEGHESDGLGLCLARKLFLDKRTSLEQVVINISENADNGPRNRFLNLGDFSRFCEGV